MEGEEMIYVVDTCVIRNIINNVYRSVMPEIWDNLESMFESGEVISVREAYNELERQFASKGEAMNWLKQYKGKFYVPSESEANKVAEIYSHRNFQNGVAKKNIVKGMPVADAFIVAKAIAHNGIVVTREVYKDHAAKIPNICEFFGVEYIGEEEFQLILKMRGAKLP